MGHTCVAKTQVNALKTVEERSFSHKGTPDASLPARASSGPTAQCLGCKKNHLTLCVALFIPKGHMTCHTCICDDIISEVIMLQDDITS